MTPWQRYQTELQRPDFVADAAQAEAIKALQGVYDALLDVPRLSARDKLLAMIGRRPQKAPVCGLYLWGGVGRGKTYLMDIFHEALPFQDKQRVHFHRFMRDVHARLAMLRDKQNPLDLVAKQFAAEVRVLCFDEFFVSDIADAMILGGLLNGLFREGVTLVATSNIPPDRLYQSGLQRQRFLPAVRQLKTHTRVLEIDGEVDYRLRYLEKAKIYYCPADDAADAQLAAEFRCLGSDRHAQQHWIEVNARRIPVRGLADCVVWFDFAGLCEGPRSQSDYIEIARTFHTVFIGKVPVFGPEQENQARRFINLVDEFYDHGVNLIIAAAAAPDRLYQGKRLRLEFQRTVSRLLEMQSRAYLAQPHRA